MGVQAKLFKSTRDVSKIVVPPDYTFGIFSKIDGLKNWNEAETLLDIYDKGNVPLDGFFMGVK